MRVRFMLILCVLLTGQLVAAQGKEFWAKKDYKTWSEKECRKLLEDSPWAKSRVIGKAMLQELAARTNERAREDAPKVEYRVQLRSAQPVRQALVRLQLIAAGYDKMDAGERKELDAQAERFLAEKFPDSVVLYVEYSINMPGFAAELARYWRTQTTALVQKDMRLHTSGGESLVPVKFVHAGGDSTAFQLTFARQANGAPILTPQDKELNLEFVHPTVGEVRSERVLLVFKVRDLLVNGEPSY